jgi:hypothetical protein
MAARDVAKRLCVRALLRPLVRLRGPAVLAVTGSHGKTTTSLLLDRLYRTAGFRVSTCTTEGVFRDGQLIHRGDFAGANGIWRALRADRPDVLVAESARGGLMKWGAGFGTCDAAAVTCIGSDHLGMDGLASREQLAAVKGDIVARVRPGGVLALAADEPLVRSLATRTAVEPTWISAQLVAGSGPAVFPRDGRLWRRDDTGEQAVIALDRIGLLDGGLRPYNLTAAGIAVAVAHGLRARLPVSADVLRRVLADFGRTPGDVPCRNELLRWGDDWVLLGSAPHPVAAEHDAHLIAGLRTRLGVRRVELFLTSLEDRGREVVRDYAACLARVSDFAWIRANRHTPAAEAHDLVAALREGVGDLPHEADGGRPIEELVRRGRAAAPRLLVITLARFQPSFDVEMIRATIRPSPSSAQPVTAP